ncbi:DUF456 domain-containing protein [candidate division KSB1 bacterium]|nr:DUF456 domain-containing protein [candidate division KSB1 bacterium]MBL7094233.1 DUF456 domain-containing protein [candidate division KSB1 bacterium]
MLLVIVTIIGIIFIISGLIGCIIPAVPGPPLSFVAILIVAMAKNFEEPLTSSMILIMAFITVVVTALDYIVPLAGAKKYGASKWGIWGSVGGMILGIVFFPPLGIIVGAFLGAVAVELLGGKQTKDALKAGWGVFVGTLLGTILKLTASFYMTYLFINALF